MKSLMVFLCSLLALLGLIQTGLNAATFTVTDTTDASPASLRAAMLQAELNNPVADTILFNIPGAGVQRIYPFSALPMLTDPMGVFIDGLSQPGASAGREPPRTAVIMIEIDGQFAGSSHGIHIASSNNKIQGLAIYGFDRNGIYIVGGPSPGISNNTIYCNYIGMHAQGLTGVGNGQDATQRWAGVYIDAPTQLDYVLGTVVDRNLISSNYSGGAHCGGDNATNNHITRNYIGTDKNGQNDYGNLGCGVVLEGGAEWNDVAGNTVAGNDFDGIVLVGDSTLIWPGGVTGYNHVRLNIVGLARDKTPLPNGGSGISLGAAGNWYYGAWVRDNWIASNTIAFNAQDGIRVYEFWGRITSADQNQINANSIYDNGGLGIDLGDNGVTANDPNDPDTGANQELNFPVIDSCHVWAGLTTVWGTIDIDTPPESACVQVFKARLDPTGYGEGEAYLDSTIPDTSGNWSIIVTGLALGDSVTATTRDMFGNTSEFCLCVAVTQMPAGVTDSERGDAGLELCLIGPNPFSSGAAIAYSTPRDGHVTLRIYSVTGDLVKTVVDGFHVCDRYVVHWNGRDDVGKRVSSGVYFVHLESNGHAKTTKLVMMR